MAKYLLKSGGFWPATFHERNESSQYALLADGEGNDTGSAYGSDRLVVENGHINDVSGSNSLKDSMTSTENMGVASTEDKLNIRETAWLSFEFSILWVGGGSGFLDCSGILMTHSSL